NTRHNIGWAINLHQTLPAPRARSRMLSLDCFRRAASVSGNTPETTRGGFELPRLLLPRTGLTHVSASNPGPAAAAIRLPDERTIPATFGPRRNAAIPPSLSSFTVTRLAIGSALRSVEIHDNAALCSASEMWVVVPHPHVTDRVPLDPGEHNPVIRARARTLDRREHLHTPDDRIAVRLERFRQARLTARRNPVNRPRLVLPRKRRVTVPIRIALDPVTDSERLSNATHHAP